MTRIHLPVSPIGLARLGAAVTRDWPNSLGGREAVSGALACFSTLPENSAARCGLEVRCHEDDRIDAFVMAGRGAELAELVRWIDCHYPDSILSRLSAVSTDFGWLEMDGADPRTNLGWFTAVPEDGPQRLTDLVQSTSAVGKVASAMRGCQLLQLGFFPARHPRAVRLFAAVDDPTAALDVLSSISWPGPVDTAAELLRLGRAAEMVRVNLDIIDDVLLPTVGWEFSFRDDAQPVTEPRWSALFAAVVGAGLATPERVTALLNWPCLRPLSRLSGEWLERGLGHVKLSLNLHGRLEAKAYVGGYAIMPTHA